MKHGCQLLLLGAALTALGLRAPAALTPTETPLTAAEVRALVERAVANQHRNDEAVNLYERREHRMAWKTEEQQKVEEDKVFRVVPTGTGVIRVVLAERGQPTPPAEVRKQLQYVEQALVWALDPRESRQKSRVEKFDKRQAERRETVDAVLAAYTFTYLGRERRNGRELVQLRLDPRPDYKHTSRATHMLAHAKATVWIEPQAAQLARIEAELERDFNVGGGILGRVYKGGRFVMEQALVENGVWLPVEISYNFRGRKFVFGFELHEQTRITDYRRMGPPAQALAQIRRELHSAQASGSP